jgi:hypothetical protein
MRVRTCLGGIAGALLLAGTAGAQDKIEIRFGTTNPPGGTHYLSGEERVKESTKRSAIWSRPTSLARASLGTTPRCCRRSASAPSR